MLSKRSLAKRQTSSWRMCGCPGSAVWICFVRFCTARASRRRRHDDGVRRHANGRDRDARRRGRVPDQATRSPSVASGARPSSRRPARSGATPTRPTRRATRDRSASDGAPRRPRPADDRHLQVDRPGRATRTTVLIRGESGTGKELVARAIHDHGLDAERPFVAVNCAALPPTLLESELFGHVRGAFTGAVGDAPRGCSRGATAARSSSTRSAIRAPEFQTKLLRVLQRREFQPVGSERSERDGRARDRGDHRRPARGDGRGRPFPRRPLLPPARCVEIAVPPLRERAADIAGPCRPPCRARERGTGPRTASAFGRGLGSHFEHRWPGNRRELGRSSNGPSSSPPAASSGWNIWGSANLHRLTSTPAVALRILEREHVARVLASTQGTRRARRKCWASSAAAPESPPETVRPGVSACV